MKSTADEKKTRPGLTRDAIGVDEIPVEVVAESRTGWQDHIPFVVHRVAGLVQVLRRLLVIAERVIERVEQTPLKELAGLEICRQFPVVQCRKRALAGFVFSIVKRKLSLKAPGRSLRTQVLLLGVAYNIDQTRPLPSPFPQPSFAPATLRSAAN